MNIKWLDYLKEQEKTGAPMKARTLKGIVHFEIHFWYVLAYLKGIQDVSLFPQ